MSEDIWKAFTLSNKMNIGLQSSLQKHKKKRAKLTPRERLYIWEHPKIYSRTCHICHQKITKLSELELDHRRAFKSGGTKLALAHKECNMMKGSKGLSAVQKKLGIKSTSNRRKFKRKIKKKSKTPLEQYEENLRKIQKNFGI